MEILTDGGKKIVLRERKREFFFKFWKGMRILMITRKQYSLVPMFLVLQYLNFLIFLVHCLRLIKSFSLNVKPGTSWLLKISHIFLQLMDEL